MTTQRRGDPFHDNLPAEEVQFMTPHFHNQYGPEPVDFSKLRLDLNPDGDEDEGEEEEEEEESEEEEEERYTRGRSRSRSVHEYDDNSPQFLPEEGEGDIGSSSSSEFPQSAGSAGEQGPGGVGSLLNSKGERTGPLQHREVAALQKGLEEATQSMSRFHSREDEEERMAADAEKRTRMLACQNLAQTNEPSRRIKLLLLGDSGVGKSSLIMRWTLDAFSPSLTSTVGVNFKSKKITVNNELIQVQVWDTAGQEQFHKITTSYYKGAQGIMLVFDVSDQKSLENVEYWIKNIKSHASDSVQVVLVGNKIDLRLNDPQKKCVDTDRGKEIAIKFGVPFYEASAKDSSHVDDAFMTLVNHIAEQTSPTKNMARTSLQGGLDRRNLVEKIEKDDRDHRKEKDKEKDKDGSSGGKTKIFSSLLHKEKKDKEKEKDKEKDRRTSPDGKSGNPDEKCIIS